MATRARRVNMQQTAEVIDDTTDVLEEEQIEVQDFPVELTEFGDNEQLPENIDDVKGLTLDVLQNALLTPDIEEPVLPIEEPVKEESIIRKVDVNVVKVSYDAVVPRYRVNEGCFDIYANFTGFNQVTVIKNDNKKDSRIISILDIKNKFRGIVLEANERVLIPTNLIFIMPINCNMHIYSKQNLAFNFGLTLTNGVDIIPASNVSPLFISLNNESSVRRVIKHGDIIAQGEIIPYFIADFTVVK